MNRSGLVKVQPRTPELFVPATEEPLQEFVRWFCTEGPSLPLTPYDGLAWAGELSGLLLYRSGQFQVQLFTFPPGTVIPPHRHPHVDSFDMFVCGDLTIYKNGKPICPCEFFSQTIDGLPRLRAVGFHIGPEDWHSGKVGPLGAAFLSFQHWRGPEPSTIGLDWEGQPANEQHGVQLCSK